MVTTYKREIRIILRKSKKPMTCGEILKEIYKRGKLKIRTKTPNASLSSIILTDIKEKGNKSSFIKIQKLDKFFKAKSYYSFNPSVK